MAVIIRHQQVANDNWQLLEAAVIGGVAHGIILAYGKAGN
jgi:hypothetical protein